MVWMGMCVELRWWVVRFCEGWLGGYGLEIGDLGGYGMDVMC